MVECVDKNDQINIYGQIKNILNNSLVGLFGNLDGLKSDGLIYGWCAWKDIKKTAVVWLQCEGFDPISLKCDNLRKGMDKLGYQNHSGFILDPNELDHKYSEKIIYFTFDKEGNYKLPQGDKLILPSINIKYTGKNNHYQKLLNNIDKSFSDVVDNDYFQKHKYLIKKYSDQDIIDIFRLCLLKPVILLLKF